MRSYRPYIAGKWFARDRVLRDFIEGMDLLQAKRALLSTSWIVEAIKTNPEGVSKKLKIPKEDLIRFENWVSTLPEPLVPWAYVLLAQFRDVDRIMNAYFPLERVP